MTMAAGRHADRAPSQTLKAQLDLRELILKGELASGERVSELQMVERLGVSRTPVRTALVRLQEEGLLEAIPSGGFAVKGFSEREVFEAIEIRGMVEGLAARWAAERGVSRPELDLASECLDAIDEVLFGKEDDIDVARYVELNAQFHSIVVDMAGSRALSRQIERVNVLPFASSSALVSARAPSPEARRILIVAQDQHRCILDAIEHREGSRAEAIMREHARIAHRNWEHALSDQGILELMPGSALLKRRIRP